MTAQVMQGSVFDVLPTLAPGSIDCVITSPPYWMLRSYLPKGHALKPLELGSEPTPAAFVANMVRVFALVREAMADHATCWLNMGDTYATGGGGVEPKAPRVEWGAKPINAKRGSNLDHGNLCLIPQRLAIALQDDGWLVRSVICWHKPAPMPSSVAGWRWMRCRVKSAPSRRAAAGHKHASAACSSHGARDGKDFASTAEWSDCPGCRKCAPHGGYVLRRGSWRPTSSWEPILLLAKSARYFADGESVKTPPAAATVSRAEYGYGQAFKGQFLGSPTDERHQDGKQYEEGCFADGANARDVQTWASEPLKEKHYAAFPGALVRWCLKAGTSARGYCPAPGCGAPWVRVIESSGGDMEAAERPKHLQSPRSTLSLSGNGSKEWAERGTTTKTVDWRPSCPHGDLPPRPGRVLDPFCGSGRTLLNAQRLGLDAVGCELNPEYVEMAARLLFEDAPLFAQAE